MSTSGTSQPFTGGTMFAIKSACNPANNTYNLIARQNMNMKSVYPTHICINPDSGGLLLAFNLPLKSRALCNSVLCIMLMILI